MRSCVGCSFDNTHGGKKQTMSKKVEIIKKNDEISQEYFVGDILEVDSTWYGGVTVIGRSRIPVSIDKDEYRYVDDDAHEAPGRDRVGTGVSAESCDYLDEIERELRGAVRDLLKAAELEPGAALVVGCSSSEVAGMRIGSYSSAEIGSCIAGVIFDELRNTGVYLAAQCCEHLNRALIVEKAYAREYRIPVVNVVPQLKAGGSFAAAAYAAFEEPVAIECIQAQAGIDIGDTLIGMHLAPVAVPVRTVHSEVGSARVVMARTRAKYIGGERACYR